MPATNNSREGQTMNSHTKRRRWLGLRRLATNGTRFSVLRAWPFWMVIGFLVLTYGAAAWHFASQERLLRNGDTPPTRLPMGADLRLPENRIPARKPVLFEYGGREDTRFVVRRQSGRQVEVFLAACASCYRRSPHPNYVLQGKVMCGMCRQPMLRPGASKPASARFCELVPVRYYRQSDELVVPFQFVNRAFQALAAAARQPAR